MIFNIHTKNSAPEISNKILENFEQAIGFVPNLLGVVAESPFAMTLVNNINSTLEMSAFSSIEQRIITVVSSMENECQYCVSAQSTLAKMSEMPEVTLQQLRSNQPLQDDKQEALRQFTLNVIRNKGYVPSNEVEAFIAKGYNKAHVIEVISLIAYMTLSNYVSHISNITVDDAFMPQQWQPAN